MNWTWEVVIHRNVGEDEETTYDEFTDVNEAIDLFNSAVSDNDTMGAIVIVHPSKDSLYKDSVMLAFDNDWQNLIPFPEWAAD